jgi:hypothetical protein
LIVLKNPPGQLAADLAPLVDKLGAAHDRIDEPQVLMLIEAIFDVLEKHAACELTPEDIADCSNDPDALEKLQFVADLIDERFGPKKKRRTLH